MLCSLLREETAGCAELRPLMVAMVCMLLALRAGLAAAARHATVAAGLTCNLGMLALHERAATRPTRPSALNPRERQLAGDHPRRSVELLRAAGVGNGLWLVMVAQHHERPDCSGYPDGRRSGQLCRAARLVALAAVAAIMLPRDYRDGIRAQEALQEIFLQRGGVIDATLAGEFINVLRMFPPGVFMRPGNGEVGVVLARGRPRASDLGALSFRSPRGLVHSRPLRRDTAVPAPFGIAEVLRRQPLSYPVPHLWQAA